MDPLNSQHYPKVTFEPLFSSFPDHVFNAKVNYHGRRSLSSRALIIITEIQEARGESLDMSIYNVEIGLVQKRRIKNFILIIIMNEKIHSSGITG